MMHTPGPWAVWDHSSNGKHDGHYIVQQGNAAPALAIIWHSKSINPCVDLAEFVAEEDANARLIAAAPELLEALQQLVATPEVHMEDMRAARAAIAKATEGPTP